MAIAPRGSPGHCRFSVYFVKFWLRYKTSITINFKRPRYTSYSAEFISDSGFRHNKLCLTRGSHRIVISDFEWKRPSNSTISQCTFTKVLRGTKSYSIYSVQNLILNPCRWHRCPDVHDHLGEVQY